MKVSELIKTLQGLPPDSDIVCQVVPQEQNSGAWMMCFSFVDLPPKSKMVLLRVEHPLLQRLTPEVVFTS